MAVNLVQSSDNCHCHSRTEERSSLHTHNKTKHMSAAAADLTYGGLKYRTFALAPQTGHTTSSRFLLATSSLVEPNVVHVVELNEEDEEVVCVNVFPHSHAVSAIAASPSDASLVLTSFVSTNGECLLLSV